MKLIKEKNSEAFLMNELIEKPKYLFEKIRKCNSEISDIAEQGLFIQRFKLRKRMILEIMRQK